MIKTLDDFYQEMFDRKEYLTDMIIESIGPDCEKDLMRWKGMLDENAHVLEELRHIMKYHECEKYLVCDEDNRLCVVCG